MTVDERVREALTDLADGVRPVPDPYGRLWSRRRRVRRRRTIAAGAALAAVAAVVLPTLPGGGRSTAVDGNPPATIHEWAERLRHTPVRGALAMADPGYVADFDRLVTERQRAGELAVSEPVSEVDVLYLDDVGDIRMAFVAFHLTHPDPTDRKSVV